MQEVTAEELAEKLPPLRDVEPPSLRQEIFDELLDHIACAARREQLAGVSAPGEVWQRVRARFGNPAQIAAQLFWDRIKGELMKQNLISAALAMIVVCCVVGLGLAWRLIHTQQQLLGEWKQLSTATSQSQSAMANELQQLRADLATASEALQAAGAAGGKTSVPLETGTVVMTFKRGSSNGPPAEGVKVKLNLAEAQVGNLEPSEYSATSDAQGVLSLNTVFKGRYEVHIEDQGQTCYWSDWNQDPAALQDRIWKKLVVRPGQQVERTVIVPLEALTWRATKVQLVWPDDLIAAGIAAKFLPQWADYTLDDQYWEAGSASEDWEEMTPERKDWSFLALLLRNEETIAGEQQLLKTSFGTASALENPQFYLRSSWSTPNGKSLPSYPWDAAAGDLVQHSRVHELMTLVKGQEPATNDLQQVDSIRWPSSAYRIGTVEVYFNPSQIAPHYTKLLTTLQVLSTAIVPKPEKMPTTGVLSNFVTRVGGIGKFGSRDLGGGVANSESIHFTAENYLLMESVKTTNWQMDWTEGFKEGTTLRLVPDEATLQRAREFVAKVRTLEEAIPADAWQLYRSRWEEAGNPTESAAKQE